MKKITGFVLISILFCTHGYGQDVLPSITVYNINNKIIISWRNEFTRPVTTINIQRSYDSSKNYTTIGSVLNPQNKENGYADLTAPYNRMYYRVFISFEGGSYILSPAEKPVKFVPGLLSADDSTRAVDPLLDSLLQAPPPSAPGGGTNYPSHRVFTGRDNNVIINLNDYDSKKYSIKFFDENNHLVFELQKLREDFLIVDKVNFMRSGWYNFELYQNGTLLDKNRFYITRDVRGGPEPMKRVGNR
ncbi:MAG: hypothetical protein ABIT96_11495 [Ferruginibacter sp.]